jgi:hypothetical protein
MNIHEVWDPANSESTIPSSFEGASLRLDACDEHGTSRLYQRGNPTNGNSTHSYL